MEHNSALLNVDLASLRIIKYPDPHLAGPSQELPLPQDNMVPLLERMFDLMHAVRGVGLAAPQVGINYRFFVACPTGRQDDRRVYINGKIVSLVGEQQDDEGCLSVPGISTKIKRYHKVTLAAQNIAGEWFEETGEGLLARIFQHETDHLDGRLIIDRMGTVAKLSYRRTLKDLEEQFQSQRRS